MLMIFYDYMVNRITNKRLLLLKVFFLFLAYTLARLTIGLNQNYIHLFFVTLVILHTPLLSGFNSVTEKFSKESVTLRTNPFFALLSATMFLLLYYLRMPSWITIPRFDPSVVIFILFIICSKVLRLTFEHSISVALFMLVLSATSQIHSLSYLGATTASLSYLLVGFGLIQHFYNLKYEDK